MGNHAMQWDGWTLDKPAMEQMSHKDLRVTQMYFKCLFREGYKHLKELC